MTSEAFLNNIFSTITVKTPYMSIIIKMQNKTFILHFKSLLHAKFPCLLCCYVCVKCSLVIFTSCTIKTNIRMSNWNIASSFIILLFFLLVQALFAIQEGALDIWHVILKHFPGKKKKEVKNVRNPVQSRFLRDIWDIFSNK